MAIEARDLDVACEWLCGVWRGVYLRGDEARRERKEGRGWVDVGMRERYGVKYLRITREVTFSGSTVIDASDAAVDEDSDDQVPDEDAEIVERSSGCEMQQPLTPVCYDIVHSASYQVPVVYITLPELSPAAASSPEQVYSLLVPDAYKSQMQAVGTMGALSMGEHPVTGSPAWFVHPCLTQDAMRVVSEGQATFGPRMYLMRWLGVIGSSIGLSVPINVAQAVQMYQREASSGSDTVDADQVP
ncbi:hypothetical protein B0A48_07284 [Cryoendolithus antarcticus]|uniref:Ubiquitin-like-conjugating enzyme ATG10 n=1 Tax=Cryoendolithus antarcticus TaxID=1507870 RepID=A0A1V8T851_9PEZI|nr:hypothetical protein B0A48_07284 [Cryoendolithus antarcticus]